MTSSKYEELQKLTRLYGAETMAFYSKVKELGPQIIAGYDAFLGGPKGSAKAVPPEGDFDPSYQYRGEALDSHGQGVIFLEPIRMGICTEIENLADKGSAWVRTVVKFSPSDGGVLLLVGTAELKVSWLDDEDPDFADVIEAIFEDAKRAFTDELDEAQGTSRIGFSTQTANKCSDLQT